MRTFNIPILLFFVHIFLKTTQLSCRRKQFNSPPQLENQNHCRKKTTQLSRKKNSTWHQERNNSTQQEETTQLRTRNETTRLSIRKQLNSATGTKQLISAEENNSTRQQERNNSSQQEKRTQLVSRNETTQLPPAPPLQQNRLFLPTYAEQLEVSQNKIICSVKILCIFQLNR
ncbi:hypothetical protein TNCV_4358681 [Trichonephila clavipes]|nr:hypothetical protein TNCV_4358681 [Trichonephila clavipes]